MSVSVKRVRHLLSAVDVDARRGYCSTCEKSVRVRKLKNGWGCLAYRDAEKNAEWRKRHQGPRMPGRWYALSGMSPERFAAMLESQGGVCAICGGVNRDRALAVDHCHATGEIRGLLCTRCNTSLGAMRDDPELLLRAAAYIRNARA